MKFTKRNVLIAIIVFVISMAFGFILDEKIVNHSATTTSPCIVPTGAGVMGICAPLPKNKSYLRRGLSLSSGHKLIPDVSEWNGYINWDNHRNQSGAIFRLYEAGGNFLDTQALHNSRRLKALHIWDAAYAFIRSNYSCSYEAGRIYELYKYVGGTSGPLIVDAEVPMSYGYPQCIVKRLRAYTHRAVVIYTGIGTWNGGSLNGPLWVATYGSSPYCVAGVCKFVAWQFSPSYNCNGIYGDCSINYSLLPTPKPKPKPGPKPHPKPVSKKQKLEKEIRTLSVKQRQHKCYQIWHNHGGRSAKRRKEYRWCRGWQGQKEKLLKELHSLR